MSRNLNGTKNNGSSDVSMIVTCSDVIQNPLKLQLLFLVLILSWLELIVWNC